MSLTLFIPVPNELDGLRIIMPPIERQWVDRILILDGGSTDISREYLLSIGYDVIDQTTLGIKAAFGEAFEHAIGSVIIAFSPDGNSLPKEIPSLFEKLNLWQDIVIASRQSPYASSRDDNFVSGLANHLFTKLVHYFFGAKLTDGIEMCKAFKKQHLYSLRIDRYKNEHAEYLIVARGARFGLKIIEIASSEPGRLGPVGSRTHPRKFENSKSGALIPGGIIRDAVFLWPQ